MLSTPIFYGGHTSSENRQLTIPPRESYCHKQGVYQKSMMIVVRQDVRVYTCVYAFYAPVYGGVCGTGGIERRFFVESSTGQFRKHIWTSLNPTVLASPVSLSQMLASEKLFCNVCIFAPCPRRSVPAFCCGRSLERHGWHSRN